MLRIGEKVIHTHDHDKAKQVIDDTENLVVISGIRELLARTISAFFQNIDNESNQWWYLGNKDYINEKGVTFLISHFKDRFSSHVENIVFPWFDIFSTNIKFNIYGKQFNTELGFEMYEAKQTTIVYRLENIHAIPIVLNNYTYDEFELMTSNMAVSKWHSNLYFSFINQILFTKSEIDYFYNNKLMNFFYTPAEKHVMISKRRIQ